MNGRSADGTFANGNAGRPKGARNRATQAVLALLEGEGEALTRKAIEMALAGDGVALRLCLDRIAPSRKDSPVEFTLPRMSSAHDAAQAAGAVLQAVSEGDLTPVEAVQVMALVDSFRRTLEITELEARIAALEGGSKPTSPLGMVNSEGPPVDQGRSSRE
jgi:hypothetical protein